MTTSISSTGTVALKQVGSIRCGAMATGIHVTSVYLTTGAMLSAPVRFCKRLALQNPLVLIRELSSMLWVVGGVRGWRTPPLHSCVHSSSRLDRYSSGR